MIQLIAEAPWTAHVFGLAVLGSVLSFMYYYYRDQVNGRNSNADLTIQISGRIDSPPNLMVYYKDELTTEQMDQIIREALRQRGKTDPALIKLLFHNSLLALGENEQFRQWYEEETGVDLREAVSYQEE
mgnify:CR=1 FL=1